MKRKVEVERLRGKIYSVRVYVQLEEAGGWFGARLGFEFSSYGVASGQAKEFLEVMSDVDAKKLIFG